MYVQRPSSTYEIIRNLNVPLYRNLIDVSWLSSSVEDFNTGLLSFPGTFVATFDVIF